MPGKRPRLESVGKSLKRKKKHRLDHDNEDSAGATDDDDDDESATSGNTAAETALMRSPRFTASQATSHTPREAGIIEEIHVMNFMNHSKLSFQYVCVICIVLLYEMYIVAFNFLK